MLESISTGTGYREEREKEYWKKLSWDFSVRQSLKGVDV
jgi:hypothetical protein